MRTSNITHALLIAVALLSPALTQRCVGQTVGAASLDTLVARLLTSTGKEYVVARDSALVLPAEGRTILVAVLKSYGDVSKGAMIASFIEVRVAFPDLAAEFDRHLQDQVDHPTTTGASPKPVYRVWIPETQQVDALIIEGVALLDLPAGLKSRLSDSLMGRRNPTLINSMMYLADNGQLGAACKLASLCRDAPEYHERVATFLVDFYRRSREAGNLDLVGVVSSLRSLGGAARLADVRSLIALERQLMPAQGYKPWDDVSVEEELPTLLGRYNSLKRSVDGAKQAGQDEQTIARLAAELALLERSLISAQARWNARSLWKQLLTIEEFMEADMARSAIPIPAREP